MIIILLGTLGSPLDISFSETRPKHTAFSLQHTARHDLLLTLKGYHHEPRTFVPVSPSTR